MHVLSDGLGGGNDKAHVRIFCFSQRGWNADVDGVELANDGVVGCGTQLAALHQGLEDVVLDVFDVRLATVEGIYFALLDVNPDYFKTGAGEFDGKRQPNISQPEHADTCCFLRDSFP